MSVKARFLKRLLEQQGRHDSFENKSQADLALFRQRMHLLQEEMEKWLKDSGIRVETFTVRLIDLLVGNSAFDVPGHQLRYEGRTIKFTPIFLYGQGVTGCVEATLCVEGKIIPLCRLFMRSGKATDWTCTQTGILSRPDRLLNEEVFFGIIEGLLP